MNETRILQKNQRLSLSQKNKESKKWYKQEADRLDRSRHMHGGTGGNHISESRRMQVNYDLFNNILNLGDFEYVCQPFGAEVGELPASMVNRDIVSGKIKAMIGMEMKRPFSWKVIATNSEATTRREQEEFGRIREFVISETMRPIRKQVELKYQQQMSGKELSEQESQQIQEQIDQETKSLTPLEVSRYMEREHQDPAEVMSHQLLEYLIQKCDLKKKFSDMFKHFLLSAKGIMYVGILNNEPEAWVVNSQRFDCDYLGDNQFVEDGEWATCEYRMSPSQVIKFFGDELTNTQIDEIYETHAKYGEERLRDSLFTFDNYHNEHDENTVRVLHCVWKSLRKIGFLTYLDEDGETHEILADESYVLDRTNGDINIDWKWIPEVYETWKLGANIYANMRPLPGQFKDLDNLHYCKLPYYGAICDNMNSQPTSMMDRLKVFQYYYNIVMYRLELLLASDKGKKVMMNINAIPDSAGIDIEKWQYFFESSPFMWFDPNEEGTQYSDVNMMAKQIDLSLASDIGKYIEFAEYLKRQAGESIGITPSVEGQIGPNDAVTNTRQNLVQSSHILEPYFELDNHIKKNVLQALLETAKIAYSGSDAKKLSYVLDDMSRKMLTLDIGLLHNSTLGLFVSNSAKAEEAKDLIRQLAHAALQNQKVELSDIISVVRQEGIVEAEETLKAAEQKRRDFEQSMQQQNIQAEKEKLEKAAQSRREEMQHDKDIIQLEYKEKKDLEVVKSALVGMSFNPEVDTDGDGVNDFLEIARHGLDADIKKNQQQLDREKFEHDKEVHKDKISVEREKIKAAKTKNNNKS